MKKLITFLFVTVCMLIMLPNVSEGGWFGVSFDDSACFEASRCSPFYNATIRAELIMKDISYIRFKFKIEGPKIGVVEGHEDQLDVLIKACESCTPFPVGGIVPGEIVSIDVDTDKQLLEVDVLVNPLIMGDETKFSLSFYYCPGHPDKPFETEFTYLCSSFVGLLPDQCPQPTMSQMPLPNPFLGAETEIYIAPEMVITTGNDQFTVDSDHVTMDIKITGNMMHLLVNEPLDQYIRVWRKHGIVTPTNVSKQMELIDEGNNKYTLRIRVLDQLKHKFMGTSYKIEYEKPPHHFEYNIDKMCTLITSEPNLPPFCTRLQLAPIESQRVPVTPADE